MKKILIPILLIAFPIFLQAQSCSIRHMFRSYDPGEEITRVHIPACLTTIATWFIDEPDTKFLLKQIKSIYVMASNDEVFSSESDFPSEIAKNLKKRNFEEMMTVHSDGDKIDILFREKGKNKEFVIAVNGDEDVLVYIRSKIDLADLAKLDDLGIKGLKGMNLDKMLKDI